MIVDPQDIYIIDLPGIPRYKVPAVSERLGFRDALSVHLGAEYRLGRTGLTLRGGYAYERGAVKELARSVMAHDGNKHLIAAGAGYEVGRIRLDFAYGLFYEPPLTVDYRESTAQQTNPIKPNLAATVGGGRYVSAMHVFSAGLSIGL